jgi:hypothetical protein
MNKKVIVVSILIAILLGVLFVTAIAETISYYNGEISSKKSKIALLNDKIANLTNQISNLNSQLADLTNAYLVTALGVTEIPYNSPYNGVALPYNNLYIAGSVTNTGESTAYNAGLHVVAYNSTGTVEINMTVPLTNSGTMYGAVFGTDVATDNYVSSNFGISSLQLITLDSGQNMPIMINIFHEGTVSNWTITPVWTNSP